MSIVDSCLEEFAARAKCIGEALIEFANRFDAQAKFDYELTKYGVREFSLNDCKVAATSEKFRELEHSFKLCNVSTDFVDEFAESVIKGINKMFDYSGEPLLTEVEAKAIRTVIYRYFNSKL